jgi:hypothetical protein
MDNTFWLKLALGFLVGSLWITLTTLSAERYGSKVGGLIGGLPSTVVIALLFIGYTQSPLVAAQATTVMPLAQGMNGLFILAFILLIPRGLKLAMPVSLLLWFSLATFLYLLDRLNLLSFLISIIGWLILLAFCYIVVERWMQIPSRSKQSIAYPPSQLIWRALFGGAVISFAVLMGKLGGPLLGGIFGSFPAMFLSTLVITSYIGGAAYSKPVGKSLLVSGLINVPLYEIMVRYLYPRVGLALGTSIAVVLSIGFGYMTFLFMKSRLS